MTCFKQQLEKERERIKKKTKSHSMFYGQIVFERLGDQIPTRKDLLDYIIKHYMVFSKKFKSDHTLQNYKRR